MTMTRLALATAIGALLAACAPDREPVAPAEPSVDQAQAREQAAADDDALRAPSRPQDDPRAPRDLDGPDAAAAQDATDTDAALGPTAAVPEAAQPLLGEWTVVGHRFAGVGAMDEAGAQQLHGRELAFSAEHAHSGADQCPTPNYRAQQRNLVETLLIEYRTSPAELGLDDAAGAQATLVEVDCINPPWMTLGSRVLLLPGDLVLASWDGVFFELQRR